MRNHSRSAVTMAMIATFPSGIQAILSARPVRKSSTVRYTECPESAWPTSWPTTARISSSSRSSTRPVVTTMIGSSRPMHIALGFGSCVTYIGGTFSRSRM